MKKILITLSCLFCVPMSYAQLPFFVMDSIDANRINAAVLVHGDMWWNPVAQVAHCQFPPASPKNIGFAGAIWMSAYDNAGQMHVSAQTYRLSGNDYWPGPLDASGALDYVTSEKWAKIWKVRRSDVNTHLGNAGHTIANTPEAILTWPAKGNANAEGKDGAPLTITEDMAPFIDLNGDGIYQPLNGEYPDIKGEQTLFWVFSDNGPVHNLTNGQPLKMQVHAMAYAYKRNTLIDYVVYHDYTVINKSGQNYRDMRVGVWEDVDLGYYQDDFIGFDSAHRMVVTYNGTNDDGGSAGHPVNSYGLNPPAVGLTWIRLPGDAGGSYVPAGGLTGFNNDASVIGNPVIDTEYNHYLRGRMRNGAPILHGVSVLEECTVGNNPGDRRFVVSSSDFNLSAGMRERLVVALVVDSAAGGCPAITDIDGLEELADTARQNWQQAVAVMPVPVHDMQMELYPVPAGTQLHINLGTAFSGRVVLGIYNGLGQCVQEHVTTTVHTVLDVQQLPPGTYTLRCASARGVTHRVFIHQ